MLGIGVSPFRFLDEGSCDPVPLASVCPVGVVST